MILRRLLVLAAAAGLGLVSGCGTMSASNGNGGFFSRLTRLCRHNRNECTPVETSAFPVTEGPMLLDQRGDMFVTPGMIPPDGCGTLVPQPGVPTLAPTPRLVPQPQSQPMPYTP